LSSTTIFTCVGTIGMTAIRSVSTRSSSAAASNFAITCWVPPWASEAIAIVNAKCASGAVCTTGSPAPTSGIASAVWRHMLNAARWLMTAPLGFPVVPEM
jgi:hypothetical protein